MGISLDILDDRHGQVRELDHRPFDIDCEKKSAAGSVSQRACVFCGSRVVLYPIADAVHLVHGPIGCAAYTWDIRGAWSSGPQLHRLSFSTDLRERDTIYGGQDKLYRALHELIATYSPKAAFVYGTCLVGLIGDDIDAVCRRVEREVGFPVIPVHSEGFKGTKKDGYSAACRALGRLIGTGDTSDVQPLGINILGDFNIAGETWDIRRYYESLGIEVVATITGDGRVDAIRRAHGASLNVVQCSGSVTSLAELMRDRFGIPYLRVSYFGIEDMSRALYDVADHFGGKDLADRAQSLVAKEVQAIMPELRRYRECLAGKRAAVYTGGAFKAISLIRSLRSLGIETVIAGSQTGNAKDYQTMASLCAPGTVILDDTNPVELSRLVRDKRADLLIGGVKERPIAYKLGLGFCDHNHERKISLVGYRGMLAFAREVYTSILSPVWKLTRRGQRLSAGSGEVLP